MDLLNLSEARVGCDSGRQEPDPPLARHLRLHLLHVRRRRCGDPVGGSREPPLDSGWAWPRPNSRGTLRRTSSHALLTAAVTSALLATVARDAISIPTNPPHCWPNNRTEWSGNARIPASRRVRCLRARPSVEPSPRASGRACRRRVMRASRGKCRTCAPTPRTIPARQRRNRSGRRHAITRGLLPRSGKCSVSPAGLAPSRTCSGITPPARLKDILIRCVTFLLGQRMIWHPRSSRPSWTLAGSG
jgi:hypothetical protein